jgi:sec-independent protein translocase protein TatA
MDVGPVELLIVLAVVLLLFGSKKLPELAKGMGQAAKEFRSGLNDESDDKKADDKPVDQKQADEKPDTPAVAAAPADQPSDPSSN